MSDQVEHLLQRPLGGSPLAPQLTITPCLPASFEGSKPSPPPATWSYQSPHFCSKLGTLPVFCSIFSHESIFYLCPSISYQSICSHVSGYNFKSSMIGTINTEKTLQIHMDYVLLITIMRNQLSIIMAVAQALVVINLKVT